LNSFDVAIKDHVQFKQVELSKFPPAVRLLCVLYLS